MFISPASFFSPFLSVYFTDLYFLVFPFFPHSCLLISCLLLLIFFRYFPLRLLSLLFPFSPVFPSSHYFFHLSLIFFRYLRLRLLPFILFYSRTPVLSLPAAHHLFSSHISYSFNFLSFLFSSHTFSLPVSSHSFFSSALKRVRRGK